MTREKALRLRAMIEKGSASLDDRDASQAVELVRGVKYDGSLIEAFTRINWKGRVLKSAAALWDTEQNDPDHAPNLWTELPYIDGIRIIPEIISLAEAFSKDELGWWKGVVYRSKKDTNVYNPDQVPGDWEAVE